MALENKVSNDIIGLVSEPTELLSPIVPVPKPNGTVRISVDFRGLNSCLIKKENFQIPTFDELSYKLCNAKIMSKFDVASGFFQIPLSEAAKVITRHF